MCRRRFFAVLTPVLAPVFAPVVLGLGVVVAAGQTARAEVKVVVDHNDNDHATSEFHFKNVPAPSKTDAAAKAKFTIVDGERDENGGELEKLNDGKVPTEQDEPAENFFFNADTPGGRIGVDLGGAIEVKEVHTYSWHPNTRGPQVYTLYASDGSGEKFNAAPKSGTDPATCGWKKVAAVDTRPKEAKEPADSGGQYGVSVADSDGPLGKYRYLLFDVSRTESEDPFGNTFYSEIDVIAAEGAKEAAPRAAAPAAGKYEITIDTSETPDLADWAEKELRPVCEEWYPKIVEMLPSEGYEAPKKFSITFHKDKQGVADTGGTRINCAANWFEHNLKGEAKGAIVHEMVHVDQQYGRARRGNRNATPNPGWLVEGIADYIRWYKYEPQSHGTTIRNPSRVHYNDSYRVTANFLNFVSEKYDKDLVRKLNAAMRQGKYNEDLWKQYTGKTPDELDKEWKESLSKNS